MRRLVSKRLDRNFAKRSVIIPSVVVKRTPLSGRLYADSKTRPGVIRDFTPKTIVFDEVCSWHVQNALVSDEFLVHDARNIYCDCSLLVAASPPDRLNEEQQALARRLEKAPSLHVIDDYAADVVLIAHNEGGGTWGHYVIQNLPRILLFLDRFPEGKVALPNQVARGESTFSQLLDAYGISRDRLIGLNRGLTYRFGEAVLMDYLYDFSDSSIHPAALDLLERISGGIRPGSHRTFIRRLSSGARSIQNADDVDKIMTEYGLAGVAIGDRPVNEQVGLWMGSDLVAGVLGSDLTNMVFARPGTQVLVLSPDWFGDNFFFNLAVARGIQWHEIRCGEIGEHAQPERNSSFRVQPELLRKSLHELGQVRT